MIKKSAILLLVLISILLTPGRFAQAQSALYLSIDRIDTSNFPEVNIYFSVLDHQGFPVSDLTNQNITLSEDGLFADPFELTPIYQHPLQLVLVVDTSASMGYGDEPTPLANLRQTTKTFINSLAASDEIALITFSNDAEVVQDLTTDKNALLGAFDSLVAEGDSLLNDGMMEAIQTIGGKAGRPAIIILMDGMDSGLSSYTLEEISNRLVQQRIPIYIISWRDANQATLEKLTALVHGELQFLPDYFPDEDAFQAALNNLSDSLSQERLQYVLSFTSNLNADGAEHEAILAVDFLNRHAEDTRHFSAEPGIVEITLLNPTNNQSVSGNVAIIPSVTAPTELARLDIALDGTALANVLTPPFEYNWDSSTVDPGAHHLSVIATDRVGNKGQIDFSVIVEEPITVQITEPLEGATVSGSTAVLAEITSHLAVDRVELFVDNVLEQTISSEPYRFDWDVTSTTAGTHKIKVITTDLDGFSAEDEVLVEVVPGSNGYGVLLIIVVGAAAILIPLGLRTRRKRTSQPAKAGTTPADAPAVPSPSGTGQPLLRELEGLHPHQVWSLESHEIKLGRKRSTNDIPLRGLKASREQGRIQYEQGQYVIYSLKPDNPILVNEIPIEKYVLQPGDLIRGGESVFRFEH